MNEQSNIDIDYEHMDDLPLLDRIEWSHAQLDSDNSASDQITKLTAMSVDIELNTH